MREWFVQLKTVIHSFKIHWDEIKPKGLNLHDDPTVLVIEPLLEYFKKQGTAHREKYDKLAKPLQDFDENVEV